MAVMNVYVQNDLMTRIQERIRDVLDEARKENPGAYLSKSRFIVACIEAGLVNGPELARLAIDAAVEDALGGASVGGRKRATWKVVCDTKTGQPLGVAPAPDGPHEGKDAATAAYKQAKLDFKRAQDDARRARDAAKKKERAEMMNYEMYFVDGTEEPRLRPVSFGGIPFAAAQKICEVARAEWRRKNGAGSRVDGVVQASGEAEVAGRTSGVGAGPGEHGDHQDDVPSGSGAEDVPGGAGDGEGTGGEVLDQVAGMTDVHGDGESGPAGDGS